MRSAPAATWNGVMAALEAANLAERAPVNPWTTVSGPIVTKAPN